MAWTTKQAVGTYEFATDIPIGATFLYAAVTAVAGFAGDVSAALTIGDGTDVDRYNTSSIDVFSTAAGGVSAGAPSVVVYHAAAKTPTPTITVNADWGSVTAGSVREYGLQRLSIDFDGIVWSGH